MRLVRVFRAVTKPGREEAFRSFFVEDAVSYVRACDGLLSVQVGLPTELTPREFLMITTWANVEALQEFAGQTWHEAVVKPEEAPLLEEVHVHHYWETVV